MHSISFIDHLKYTPNNIQQFKSIPTCCKFTSNSHSFHFTPYAIGENSGNISIISNSPVCWKYGSKMISSLDWSPDDQVLAAGSADSSFKLWNVTKQLSTGPVEVHTSSVISLNFHPAQSNLLVSGESLKTVCIWDLRESTARPQKRIVRGDNRKQNHNLIQQLNKVNFVPFSNQLITLFQDSLVFYDCRWTKRILNEIESPSSKGFVTCCLDLNGNYVYALGKDSNVYVIHCEENNPPTRLECKAQSSSFCSDIKYFEQLNRKYLATSSSNNSFLIWDLDRRIGYKEKDCMFQLEPTSIDISSERNEIIICTDSFDSFHLGLNEREQINFDKYPITTDQSSITDEKKSKRSKQQASLECFFSTQS